MGPKIDAPKIQTPAAFGGLTVQPKRIETSTTDAIKLNSGNNTPNEVADSKDISLRAAEQNYENQSVPSGAAAALAKFSGQDKALMPPKPGIVSLVQNNFRSAINPKDEPKRSDSAYYIEGGEAEQAEELAA